MAGAYQVLIHGEQVHDSKLVKETIKRAPEAIKLTYGRIKPEDPANGYSGELRNAPTGLYLLMGPPSVNGSWMFQMVIKNGNGAHTEYILS